MPEGFNSFRGQRSSGLPKLTALRVKCADGKAIQYLSFVRAQLTAKSLDTIKVRFADNEYLIATNQHLFERFNRVRQIIRGDIMCRREHDNATFGPVSY